MGNKKRPYRIDKKGAFFFVVCLLLFSHFSCLSKFHFFPTQFQFAFS